MEDGASQGQPKRKPEIPVVTRESRRNSRKTTWSQRLRKMGPLPATASHPRVGTETSCSEPVEPARRAAPSRGFPTGSGVPRVKPALRPPTGSTTRNPSGKRAGRRASWVRIQSSPEERAGRGKLRAGPVQSPPLQKEEPGSLLYTQRSGLRRSQGFGGALGLWAGGAGG